LVREVGPNLEANIGRPAVLLELDPEAGHIVSAELGVDFLSLTCMDFTPNTVWQNREPFDPQQDQQTILDRLLELLRQAVERGSERFGRVLGIAIGVPGLVDETGDTLLFAPNLGWKNVALRQMVREQFDDVPVYMDNEANMATLGEYFFGAAQGYDEVLYLTAGAGLGGGIVQGSSLLRGKTGVAGEFGHMTMDPEGELCNCGNQGCWETQVSQPALLRYIRRGIENGRSSVVSTMIDGDLDQLTIEMVVEAARAGDAVAQGALETMGRHLGIGVASLVNALNPDLVVLGGILSLAGEFLLPIAQAEVDRRALSYNAAATQIVLAQYGLVQIQGTSVE
jgi:glucokinase-like ROK family protein